MTNPFRSLTIRNYRLYAAGSLVSNIGTWMQNTAQAWLVLELTGSGTILGFTLALQLLPTLLLSPLAGAVADRVSKRRLLIAMQIAMVVPSALLGFLAVIDVVEVWHVLAIATVFGVARAFEAPARQSFVPEMVGREQLANAVGLNSASFNSGRLIGPAVAGLLIGAFGGGVIGTGWAILINAASYAGSILALVAMDGRRLNPSIPTKRGSGSVRDGVVYLGSRPDLVLTFVTVFFIGAFAMNFQITSSLMATEEFGKGAEEFGLLGTVLAIGSLAGSLVAAARSHPRLRIMIGAALAFSVVQVASGLMPTFGTYAFVLPLVGVSMMTITTTANTLIQLDTTPELRGRLAALYLMVFVGSVPLGAPVVGFIAETFGARTALIGTGLLVALGVLLATAWYLRRVGMVVRWNYRRPVRLRVIPALPAQPGDEAAL